mmetsp:Transcript_31971/g.80762  ORF Transcript_31971/g.80762 Transcript_31971/m.80762 type:complete len:276 (+) Transcript_31971:206-1033(+)
MDCEGDSTKTAEKPASQGGTSQADSHPESGGSEKSPAWPAQQLPQEIPEVSDGAAPREVKPLYQWVFGKLAAPVRRWTVGTARVDIKRPCVAQGQPQDSLWRVEGAPRMGSRMKLMRDVHMWQRDTGPPLFRIGLGCQFELEPNNASDFSLQARARLHKFATLKLLPQPALKLHYELPLLDTGLVASLNYYCPFVEDLRSPIHPPASIMLRLDNRAGSGLHFSPMGIELDERILALNATTSIRVAAGIGFPRQIPMPEGDKFGWRIHRLGLKTRW